MDIGNLVMRISADASNFTKTMDSVSSQMKNVGDKIASAGKTMSLAVTAPLMGIATAATKAGMDFEASMSEVRAISGATGDDFKKLEDIAKQMGSTTKFSASQSADGLKFMALAGWDASQMVSALPGVLALASAGNMELASASDIVTDTMSAFQMSAEEAGRAADIFAAASSKSNTDVIQLGEAMKYAAPVANSFGATLEHTAAIAGRMADAGIKGSMAGTALRAGFLRLAAPTEDATALLGQLGVATTNADGSMRDIIPILKDLEKGTSSMSEEQKIATMQTLFGTNAMAGWMAVLDGGVDALEHLSQEMENASGTAERMAEIMMDNAKGGITQLKSAMEGLGIQIYGVLEPSIKNLIERTQSLISFLSTLDERTLKMIITIAGFAAAIGPVLIITGKLVTAFGALAPVIGAIASPIGLVVIAVAGLVAGLVHLFRTNEEFRDKVISAWQMIQEKAAEIFESIKVIVKASIDAILAFWQEHGDTIMIVVSAIWDFITNTIETALNVIRGVFDFFKAVFTGNWEEAWGAVKSIVSSVWDGIVKYIEIILGTIIKVLLDVVPKLLDAGARMIEAIWDGIKSLYDSVINWFKDTFSGGILAGLASIVGSLAQAGANLVNGVLDGMKKVGSSVATWAKNFFGGIANDADAELDRIKASAQFAEDALERAKNASAQAKAFYDTDDIFDPISGTGQRKAQSATSSIRGNAIDGQLAFGGSVLGGGSYLVGERGPEIFTPKEDGEISVIEKAKNIVQIPQQSTIDLTKNTISDIYNQITKTLKNINNSVSNSASSILSKATDSSVSNIHRQSQGDSETNIFSSVLGGIRDGKETAINIMRGAEPAMSSPNVTINVSGVGDPNTVAERIVKILKSKGVNY
jgi:TP901 family phage tail tape measure protein